MIVELHMLQNFAPANLNRDDTGAPKDCEFGEVRRARISSQAQKRAIRLAFEREDLLPSEDLGKRTRRLVDAVVDRLSAEGRDTETARRVAEAAIPGTGLKLKDGQTEYLLFLGHDELELITDVCRTHWETLVAAAPTEAKASKKEAKAGVPREITAALGIALDGRRATDVALFGRMLADLPAKNRDAASQVAHAISTNRIEPEFDFFTAVDDLKGPEEDAGAGMMGTVEFNSSCFYRYANIDLKQLRENLGGDEALASRGLAAFLQAAITAIPTGKQKSFAAQNPPSLVFAVVRDRGAWSLANAFVKPVSPGRDGDLIGASVQALDNYWGRLTEMYGDTTIEALALSIDRDYAACLTNLIDARVPNVPALIECVLKATFDSAAG